MTFSNRFKLFLSYVTSIFFECLALIFLIATLGIDLSRKIFFKVGNQPKTPILLVHGYMHSSAAWIYLSKQLMKAGFGPIFSINLGSPFQCIEDYAARIKKKAEIIAHQTGNKKIILIGHSMGGVVCSYYTTHLAPKGTVKAVITMGSPLLGTRLGILGWGECAKQMRFNSKFTKDLSQSIKDSADTPFYHLASSTDLMIRPPNSAWMNSLNPNCFIYEDIGHISLLYSPQVAKKIIELCEPFK